MRRKAIRATRPESSEVHFLMQRISYIGRDYPSEIHHDLIRLLNCVAIKDAIQIIIAHFPTCEECQIYFPHIRRLGEVYDNVDLLPRDVAADIEVFIQAAWEHILTAAKKKRSRHALLELIQKAYSDEADRLIALLPQLK